MEFSEKFIKGKYISFISDQKMSSLFEKGSFIVGVLFLDLKIALEEAIVKAIRLKKLYS